MAKNKRAEPNLSEEVAPLLEKSITAEAEAKVWGLFEDALLTLDSDSILVLKDYFAGHTLYQLTAKYGVTHREMVAWIERARRDLLAQIQRKATLRQ